VGTLLLFTLLSSCTPPARTLAARAASLGFAEMVVAGTDFEHVVFRNGVRPAGVLHVYLDGDGLPGADGHPSLDPTPRHALVLQLMALESLSSLYLGRPCYHGRATSTGCRPALWTTARYSEVVVSSMAAALRRVLAADGVDRVVWIGYSGGGTLAMLLAPRFPETAGVLTVGANLDVDAWTDHHGYPRLTGSLNPATLPPLPGQIYQRHYVGSRDVVVPPRVTRRGVTDATTLFVMPTYTHTCCWEALWPVVLDELAAAIGTRPAPTAAPR